MHHRTPRPLAPVLWLLLLFEPFFTTKGTDKGTGLGMSLCRTILDEHEGSMELESSPGAGTTVTLLLPVAG